MSKLKKIIIGLLVLLISIPIVGTGYVYYKLNSVYDKQEAKEISDKIEPVKEEDGITNILLIGVDGNYIDKGNRSDAMMIATIDTKNNEIRLTSLARDTYVEIPGYGTEKLTHAYAYEGPSLLLQTISKNFGINIDKYVAVSFESFEKIIDAIGGVDIDVIDREVSYITGVNSPGLQTLNGKQALEYSRIRYADSAYQRDNRQRNVIQSAYKKLLTDYKGNFMDVGKTILSYTKTNMTPNKVFGLVNKVIKIKNTDFEQMEFPLEGHRTGHIINQSTGWVIEWEKDYNIEMLNKFIFGEK